MSPEPRACIAKDLVGPNGILYNTTFGLKDPAGIVFIEHNDVALADSWKRDKLSNIALLLRAAIAAQGRVGLMLNVRRVDLDRILVLLPSLQGPTISSLSDPDWVAVNTIIEEKTVRDLIPKVKAAGGQGIVEYPLNKIVL